MFAARSQLRVLSLSDNDKLSGSLPPCWLSHKNLQELQLAGLSDLSGPLPDATHSSSSSSSSDSSSSSSSKEQLCGFGKLKYVNMAGIIGDAEQGLTGQCVATGWAGGLGNGVESLSNCGTEGLLAYEAGAVGMLVQWMCCYSLILSVLIKFTAPLLTTSGCCVSSLACTNLQALCLQP